MLSVQTTLAHGPDPNFQADFNVTTLTLHGPSARLRMLPEFMATVVVTGVYTSPESNVLLTLKSALPMLIHSAPAAIFSERAERSRETA